MRLIDADLILAKLKELDENPNRTPNEKRALFILAQLVKNEPTATVAVIESEIGFFDVEEVHENCTVQVLRNSITGEVSVGWKENDK